MADDQDRTANVVLTADTDNYRQQVQLAARDTATLSDRVDRLTRALDGLAKSAGRKLMIGGGISAAGVTATTLAFANFDKQMTALKVNAEVTGRSYDKMTRNVNAMRREFGMSTSAAVGLQKSILGFTDSSTPIEKLTKTFAKLGAATQEAPANLSQGLLQLQRSMGTSQTQTVKYANVLADLSIKSGVSASSILSFSQAIAPIGRVAGMSQAAIMGVSTAFNKSGQDGYAAANAFNKMLTDIMTSVQSGSPDLAKYANLIGVTVDQFRKMDKTQAITQVFDELNRLGPGAIQILNRMGLDGIRTQRAITSVSQQSGGIGTAISEAVSAYNDPSQGALNKGSAAAMDSLSEKIDQLSQSTQQFAEAIGSNFNGPAKIFVSTLEKIVAVGDRVANSPLGKLAAWTIAAIGPMGILVGLLLKYAAGIGAIATGRILTQNYITGGYKDAQAMKAAAAAGNIGAFRPGKFGQAVADDRANFIGKAQYAVGQAGGTLAPLLRPGIGSRALGLLPAGARIGADFLAMAYDPLQPGNIRDPSGRLRIFANARERAAAGSLGGQIFSRSYERYQSAVPPGMLGGFGANMAGAVGGGGRFMGRLMGAGVGMSMMADRAAFRVAPMALRGLAAGGSSLLSALGPVGIAMYGGIAASTLGASIRKSNSMEGQIGAGADNLSFMSAYKAAVGDATTATNDFATALHNAAVNTAPSTKKQALMISEQDKAEAAANKNKLTDPRIKDISSLQATNLLRSELHNGATPADLQAMKMDLVKRFGADPAAKIISNARGGGDLNVQRFMNQMADSSGSGLNTWFGLKTNGSLTNQYKYLEGAFKEVTNKNAAQGGAQASGEAQKVLTNQFVEGAAKLANAGRLSSGEKDRTNQFINKTLFGGRLDVGDETSGWYGSKFVTPENQYDVNMTKVYEEFKKSRVKGLQSFYGQILNTPKKSDYYEDITGRFDTFGLTRKEAEQQVKAGKGTLFNNNMDVANMLSNSTTTAAESFQNRIALTQAGALFRNNPTIQTAVANPGNQNAQIQAADAMVSILRKHGVAYSNLEGVLLRFQGAIQDTNNPLYQLAASASAVAQQQASMRIAYGSTAEKGAFAANSFKSSYMALDPRYNKDLPPDAEAQRKQKVSDIQGVMQGIQQHFEDLNVQQREFNIQKKRSDQQFNEVQLPRMDTAHTLSVNRAQDAYDRQVRLSEQQYNIQRGYEEHDYALQRSYSFHDFHLQRTRQETQYNLQRTRQETSYALQRSREIQQFNIAEKDALKDYNLSRKRAAADFAHQEELTVKASAKSMMDIYTRTAVQRTWSGAGLLANARDQNQRMAAQSANLDKARSAGVSSDVIDQLGFTDAANAQQLARFVADIGNDPALIKSFNDGVKKRLVDTKALVTDQDNAAWNETVFQYRQSLDRGEQDFNTSRDRAVRNFHLSMDQQAHDFGVVMRQQAHDFGVSMDNEATDFQTSMGRNAKSFETNMARGAAAFKLSMATNATEFGIQTRQAEHDYNVSLSNMKDDYKTQQTFAQQDLGRFQKEVTKGFTGTLETSVNSLGTWASKQAQAMLDAFTGKNGILSTIRQVNKDLKTEIMNGWKDSPGVSHQTGSTPTDRNAKARNAGSVGGGGTVSTTGQAGTPGTSGSGATVHSPVSSIAFGHANSAHFGDHGSHWSSVHTGEDYAVPTGTPIHAVLPGTVTSVGWGGAYGNLTKIRHAQGIETWYAHQSRTAAHVGEHVRGGETIGYVGATGNVTGPHVHLELRVNGIAKDPDNIAQYIKGVKLDGGGAAGLDPATFKDPRKTRYGILENQIEGSPVGGLYPKNFISKQINLAARGAIAEAKAAMHAHNEAQLAANGVSGLAKAAPSSLTANQAIVKAAAAKMGWGTGNEWNALYRLVMGESGFRNNVVNGQGSSAYGLFQFLDGTWPKYGPKTSDPILQSKYGMQYIKNVYGDPENAYAKWSSRSPHWYGKGSVFTGPQTIGVGESGPEAVLPLNERGADFIATLLSRYSGEAKGLGSHACSTPMASTHYHSTRVDSSTNFSGPVSVVSQDPDEMAKKLQAKARRARLVKGTAK